jgi:uncharacterized protein
LRARGAPDYSRVVFWFWFWWIVRALFVVVDVAWWMLVINLTKRRLWRIIASIFIAGQLAAHVSAIAGVDWPRHVPKAVLVAAMLWHYLALVVFPPLVIVCAGVWMMRRRARRKGGRPDCPGATPAGAGSLTRREFVGAAAALAPPLFTIGLTGVALAQLSRLRVRRFTLAVPALPRALDGMTLAHVTDVHAGPLMCGRALREIANTTNALRADLVLFTGDLIDYALADLSEGLALVKAMEGRYGLWMVEGNHDLLENGGEFERRVKASGMPLLLDESAVTNVRGHPVQIFGLRWIAGAHQRQDRLVALQLRQLMRQRLPEAFPVLLSHHPHALDAAARMELPLTLAGHTHGGQLMLNQRHGVGPFMFRYWSGLYRRGGGQMIVSNGVGNWFPLRINAPAEIVHLTLRCGEIRG